MRDQIRISAKNLGQLALPDFCPRCFWLDMHMSARQKFPFPGIFNSIDSYTKQAVHGWFDVYGAMPRWFSALSGVVGYTKAPTYHTFYIEDADTNIRLTGSPDDIFVCGDGSHLIVDYKTAKYTRNADALMPMYEVQLNAYALISMQCEPSPVSGLVLIYMEPITDAAAARTDINLRETGFAMGFQAHIHPIAIQPGIVTQLMRTVREIYDLPLVPAGLADCANCQYTNELAALVTSQAQ